MIRRLAEAALILATAIVVDALLKPRWHPTDQEIQQVTEAWAGGRS